jgi:hypothetical protein
MQITMAVPNDQVFSAIGQQISNFFIKPPSTVSNYTLPNPGSSTYSKDVAGTSVLSTKTQTPAFNPFGVITEFLGKAFNPVATGAKMVESTPRTLTTPVVKPQIDLASIFGLVKDGISLGNNIFGTTSTGSQASALGGNRPLTSPIQSPIYNTNAPGVDPTYSSVSRTLLATTTNNNTTNTGSAGNNNWIWIVILLAIIAVVAISRKG